MSSSKRTEPKPAPDWVYFAIRGVILALLRLLVRFEVSGRDRLPATGGYLLTGNHLSIFDAPVGLAAMPRRAMGFAADKWRGVLATRLLLETLGIIWVARGEADVDAIKAALGRLKRGTRLGVAPEGTRSPTHALLAGKPGAAYLADRAGVPIVPMIITGTETIGPSWRRLRRPHVRVAFGEPYRLPGNGRAKGAQLDEMTEIIMCRLAAMLPPEYRGHYADHPRVRALLGEAVGQSTSPSSL